MGKLSSKYKNAAAVEDALDKGVAAHDTQAGRKSDAEGELFNNATSAGKYAHAEGDSTTASGNASHASGTGTIAKQNSQTVIGKYNKEDTENKYAFIVGNGTASQRSNALAVGWDGKLYDNDGKEATPAINTETWTFVLEDGTTVEKKVGVGE